MSKIFKIFTILFLIINLSNCRWITGSGPTFLETLKIHTPDGTPKFKQGFHDGCSTVLSARGNMFYRDVFKHNFDSKLIDDSEYSFGYKRGYSYCFQYVTGGGQLGSAADTFIYPKGNATPFTQGMGSGNIDNTVIGGSGYGALGWWAPGSLDGVVTQTENSGSGSLFGSYPTWGTPSTGQIFGQ